METRLFGTFIKFFFNFHARFRYVKGSRSVLKAIRETIGIKSGQTTSDSRYSLETVRCIGAWAYRLLTEPLPCVQANRGCRPHLNLRNML
jgi:hypothetical protein